MVAVIAHDRREVIDETEIEALADLYESLRGYGRRHAASAGSFARLIKFDSPSVDRQGIERAGDNWVAATGVVYPRGSLLGIDPCDLDGQFTLVCYDAPTGQLEVWSDPFGMHALYQAQRDGKTYLSTSALALARYLRARPNLPALALLVRCGQQYGPMTNWDGIERIGAATCQTFSPDGRSQSTYWRLQPDDAVAGLRFPRAVDHAIEVLTAVFQQRFADRPRLWIDLTGGYDTRLLSLVLRRAGVDFRANTVGAAESADARIASQIAHIAGWEWTRYEVPDDWASILSTRLPHALAWADGRLPVVRLAEVLWLHEQKSHIHPALLLGGGGHAFRGHAWRQEFFRAGRSTHVNYDRLIAMLASHGSLLADVYADEVAEYLRAQLQHLTRPYSGHLNTTQLDVFMAHQCAAWEGMFSSASEGHLQCEVPFLFKQAFGTAFSTSYRHRNSHRLMRAMIERLDPRIAAITTTSGGPAQVPNWTNAYRFAPYYTKIARATITKLTLNVRDGGLLARAGVEDPRVATGTRALVRHLDLTPSTMLSTPLYQPRWLEEFLRQAVTPGFAQGDLLDRVITVELLLRATEQPSSMQEHERNVYPRLAASTPERWAAVTPDPRAAMLHGAHQ
jgi:hypothetical protein